MRKMPLVIVFVVLAAAAAGVGYVMREPSPEVVLARAFRQLHEAKAVSMKVTASAYAPGVAELVPVLVSGAVYANVSDDRLPSAEAALILLGSGGGERPDLSVETRFRDDGSAFIFVDGFPVKEGADDELNGKWFSVRGSDLAAMLLGGNEEQGKALADDAALHAWRRVRSAVMGGEIFAYGGRMPNEAVGGSTAMRYALLFEREAVVKLAKDVRVLLLDRELGREEEKALFDAFEGRQAGVEVWIDKKSGAFRKLTVTVGAAEATGEAEDRERKNLVIEFQGFSPSGDIEAPAGARPFTDVAARILKGAK
jgi:hypothetical protein